MTARPSGSRIVREDRGSGVWCVEHKCMMLPARLGGHLCPFCWAEDHPEHRCPLHRDLCHACLARLAVENGTAPWMTMHGQEQYRRAFA